MKKSIYAVLCAALLVSGIVACKKKEEDTKTTVDCAASGLSLSASIPAGTANVNLTATGGKAPYKYAADGGADQDASTFTCLTHGGHTFKVTDANGCSYTTGATITNLCDSRDSKTYTTAVFGGQTWTTQNLAYNVNGSRVINDQTNADTIAKYGRLYDYTQATAGCPTGWHLPTDNEWKTFELFLGMTQAEVDADNGSGNGIRGTKANLIKPGTEFNGVFSGQYNANISTYIGANTSSGYWTSTAYYSRTIGNSSSEIRRFNLSNATGTFSSVRCIKD